MNSHLLRLESLSSSSSSSAYIASRCRIPPPPHSVAVSAITREEKSTTGHSRPKTVTITTPFTIHNSLPPPPPPPPAAAAPPSLSAAFCKALDDIIDKFIDPPHLRPSVDPRNVLSGNFAPVDELPPTPCPVIYGAIPPCLAGGAYIRNGPNPQHYPRGTYHLFDGDGMLHSLLLPSAASDGCTATFCSRYVKTYKYNLENRAGGPVLPNIFSGFHGLAGVARSVVTLLRVLTGQLDPSAGVGLANTSLAFMGRTLYALGESDHPYAVHVSASGELATLGRRLDVGGHMTAHPKPDPTTGEHFAFRCSLGPPFLTYFRFDRTGEKAGPEVAIKSINSPTLIHDFAVTANYAIIPDVQLVLKPLEMVLNQGSIVGPDRSKPTRVGVLDRYAEPGSEPQWFHVSDFNVFHVINAWEEDAGSIVVLVAPVVVAIEHALDRIDLVKNRIELVRLDLRTGAVQRTTVAEGRLDFGVVNPRFAGRSCRYAYLSVGAPMPKIGGLVKLDLDRACVVGRREFGPGQFGGEPFFVPARSEGGEEDEGYLVMYVHDEGSRESRFVVMDAASSELDVVAEVALPARVPYGFHGLFLSQDELQSQRARPIV